MAALKPGDIIKQGLSFEDFKLVLYGYEVVRFSAFEFKYDSDIVFNPGQGGEPASWSIKSYKRECKATLHADEMMTLFKLATAYGGDVLKLAPAPIIATCINTDINFKLMIPSAKCKNFSLNFKVDDSKSEVPIDIAILSYPIITVV